MGSGLSTFGSPAVHWEKDLLGAMVTASTSSESRVKCQLRTSRRKEGRHNKSCRADESVSRRLVVKD